MTGGDTLLVVLGPTAAGKSDLAVDLALELDGEVVSADSMQVYRGFDIGTGKLGPEEMRGVPHHLLDVADPEEHFSAARYVELADHAIEQVHRRGRRSVIAGGTGLYIRALLQGLFRAPPADPELRRIHRRIAQEQGVETLYRELVRLDPDAAERIAAADFVRISRALEVQAKTGRRISELHQEHGFAPQRYRAVRLGLAHERDALRRRIDRRVDAMMAAGWLDEVRHLVAQGHGDSHPMGALGYRQLSRHLAGELDLQDAVRETKRDTWRFARRQLNWFRSEPEVRWIADRRELSPAEIAEQLARADRTAG